MRIIKNRCRRGIVLLSSYVVLSIILGYTIMSVNRGLTEEHMAERKVGSSKVLEAAEAGLDEAITQLAANGDWTGIGLNTLLQNGAFEVDVDPPYETGETAFTGNGNLRRIIATGYFPSNVTTASGYQKRQIEAIVSLATSKYDYGLFAAQTIQLDSNTVVDSYNASLGNYNQNGNIGADGDVGSNATGAGTINLESNARINGDAAIGPGGNTTTGITLHNATITGTRSTLISAKTLTPESFSGNGTSPLVLSSNQSATLAGGTYSYTYVTLNSNAHVLVSGNATIYVDQYFKLESNSQFITSCPTCTITLYVKGAVTDPQHPDDPPAVELKSNSLLSAGNIPSQLKVYVTGLSGAARPVELNSNTAVYGTIDAPLSELEMDSNAALFGAAIAKEIEMDSNAQVHYDTSLRFGGGGNTGSVRLQSWREL